MSGHVTFDRNVEDLIGAYQDWSLANLTRRRSRWSIRLLAIIAVFLLGGWRLDDYWAGAGKPLYGAAAGVGIMVPVCWLTNYLLLPSRSRRIYDQLRITDPTWTWQWSEDGLSSSSANGHNHYSWHEFHAWVSGKHTLLFLLNDYQFLYVAHRVLGDGQGEDLAALARQYHIPRFDALVSNAPPP